MKTIIGANLVLCLLMISAGAWALSESEQQAMDQLQADLAFAMMQGEPELHTLFSTQGSALIMGTEEGFIGATRGKLRSDADLAAQFRLPEGLALGAESLSRAGEFIMGRLEWVAPGPLPPPTVAPRERPAMRDLRSAFMWSEEQFYVRREQLKAPAAPLLPPPMLKWDVVLAAVQDGPGRTWRLVTLAVTPQAEAVPPAEQQAALDNIRAWEHTFMQGDISLLSAQLYPDPFCVAAHTPDGQSWFFTYPEYLTTMLGSALAMGSAERSQMLDLDARVSGQVATVTGHWLVDVPIFGSMVWQLAATLVRPEERWLLVSLCAGLVEGQ